MNRSLKYYIYTRSPFSPSYYCNGIATFIKGSCKSSNILVYWMINLSKQME
ncbi:hypothetical protein Hanom_Chr16g01465041 [Helianthus anomalus]